MAETLFCYHCRVHHPKSQMTRYLTTRGYRWRCMRSIQAARQAPALREEFGRFQTALNRNEARRKAQYTHLVRCVRQDGGGQTAPFGLSD